MITLYHLDIVLNLCILMAVALLIWKRYSFLLYSPEPYDPQLNLNKRLIHAASTNNAARVRQLIDRGADVNYIFSITVPAGKYTDCSMEMTPILLALSSCNKEIACLLLDAGASLAVRLKQPDGSYRSIADVLQRNINDAQACYKLYLKIKEMDDARDKYY